MTKQFDERKFAIPELTGISQKSIEEHLKLYSGYVKNSNIILSKLEEYSRDPESNVQVLNELQRRFGFEFDGMRNHEYYFNHFEGGPSDLSPSSPLYLAIEEEWGSYTKWLERFKFIAFTRGVGWAVLYYDKVTNRLLNAWIDEQHLGHLTGLQPVLMLDMWEHSFVADYQPSGKKQYIEDFFTNLNWQTCEANFSTIG